MFSHILKGTPALFLVLGSAALAQQIGRRQLPPEPATRQPTLAPEVPQAPSTSEESKPAPAPAGAQSTERAALGVSFGNGLIVDRVALNGPAMQLGLQPGDRIVSLNGEEFLEVDPFIAAVTSTPMDRDVDIVFERNGQRFDRRVRLVPWNSIRWGQPQAHLTMRPYSDGSAPIAPQESASTDPPAVSDVQVCCCDPQPFGSGGYVGTWTYGFDDGYRYGRGWRRPYRSGWAWTY